MEMSEALSVFLLEDDTALALGAVYALRSEGFDVIHVTSLNEAKRTLKNLSIQPDIFLLDC